MKQGACCLDGMHAAQAQQQAKKLHRQLSIVNAAAQLCHPYNCVELPVYANMQLDMQRGITWSFGAMARCKLHRSWLSKIS